EDTRALLLLRLPLALSSAVVTSSAIVASSAVVASASTITATPAAVATTTTTTTTTTACTGIPRWFEHRAENIQRCFVLFAFRSERNRAARHDDRHRNKVPCVFQLEVSGGEINRQVGAG